MVKAVVGDEAQLSSAEERISRSGLTSQVGLVIGKLSPKLDRGFIYDLIPTPQNDAGDPACSLLGGTSRDDKKKGSKSKPQPADSPAISIDNDWVAEHARQVSRMLVGGVKVIGIYVWVSDSAFKNSTIALCQVLMTLKAVAEAAPVVDADIDERLLVHICYSPRRWTCRNFALSSSITSSSLRPCDFKMGKILSNLQAFRCMYDFELRLPVGKDSSSSASTLSTMLRRGVLSHANDLKAAKALVDGNLVVNEEPCKTDFESHQVELLLPFMKGASLEACSQKDVIGLAVLRGSVCSFAYSNAKEPVSQAVADIKDDLIRTLQSRLDLICEADEDMDVVEDGGREDNQDRSDEKPVSRRVLHSVRDKCNLSFPRRVFVPWLAGTFFCDYLQPSETLEVVKDHCVEFMSMETPPDISTILEPEAEAPSLIPNSFWDVAVPGHSVSSPLHGKNRESSAEVVASVNRSGKPFNLNAIAAVFILLLSILVGFLFFKRH